MKKIKFYLSLLLLNVSFVHGAQELDPVHPAPLQTQKVPSAKMRKAMQNCVEYIRAASSLYEDTATYFKEQQNKFDPSNPENLTIANAKFVISFMKEGFLKRIEN